MPLADAKERKQNEENTLLDFRLQGKQLTLHTRPSTPSSRPSSRLESAFRAMSATPTLTYQEQHRKTPPWTRPQSADHLSRGTSRRKLAAKFEKSAERRNTKNHRKTSGSVNNLLENSSVEDGIDSETSVTPSPVPSLSEVLRSNGKLEPGLAGKPPLPPGGLGAIRREHKSLDDIINIKFQRWFPEAIQETYNVERVAKELTVCNLETNKNFEATSSSKSSENLTDYHQNSSTSETQIRVVNYSMNFEAYESPRLDAAKKLHRTQTMETIHEGDDNLSMRTENQLQSSNDKIGNDILKSKLGQSLNKYLNNDLENGKKKVTIDENTEGNKTEETGRKSIVRMIEESDQPAAVVSCLMRESTPIDREQIGDALNKMLGEQGTAQVLKYVDSGESLTQGYSPVLPSNGEIGRHTGLNSQDILSWISNGTENGAEDKNVSSTFHDIIKMLKVLEKEEVESLKLEALSVNRSVNNSVCSSVTPVGTRDILTLIDDMERSDSRAENSPENRNVSQSEPVKTCVTPGRMGQLLSLDSSELAQRVMALSLELDEKSVLIERSQSRLDQLEEKLTKQKSDADAIIKRHQKFIDQLLKEKRLLGEQCASIVKEMEEKQNKTIASMESRHGVEMKKLQEKIMAAEKLKREKWESERIKKIKEQTVKGLEPELERMSRAHQDELNELRRAHERELSELEAASSRRLAAIRDQSLKDREQAVLEEREAARKKLESELGEVERSYQEQRRRLMNDVREEKERVGRDAEAMLTQRSRQLEEKWREAERDVQTRLSAQQEKHEAEMKNLRETLEGERQSWLTHQTQALSEKERQIRETVKKERDRHIEAVIRRLDQEAREKEKSLEAKISRLKEEYEKELKDSEMTILELKRKLKESRSEVEEHEGTISKLRSQLTQLECQLATIKQQTERLEYERSEYRSLARSEACSQIAALQRELTEERLKKEEMIAGLHAEKERELQQVYNRVKEAISKKEETVRLVQKQRDAALEQCSQLEVMLDQFRKEMSLNRK